MILLLEPTISQDPFLVNFT